VFRSLLTAFVLGIAGAIVGLVLSKETEISRSPVFYLLPYIVGCGLGIIGAVAGATHSIVEAIAEATERQGKLFSGPSRLQ
jgi:hypothetical protein